MYKHCLFSVIALLSWSLLHAQEHTYVDYTVKDGLAGSTVYAMAQDKDGFMWFGTETGLSRFDGARFRNFYTADGLPDNEIIKLFVDSRNRIWIIPFKNSICYYWHGMIHNQQNDPLLRRLPIHSEVVSVMEDGQGRIAVSEADAIHLIDTGNRITTIHRFDGRPFLLVQTGLNDKRQCRFMIGVAGRGIILVDLDRNGLVYSHNIGAGGPNNYSSTYIGPSLEIHENNDGVDFLDNPGHRPFRVRMPRGFINMSHLNDSEVSLNAYSATLLVDIRRHKIVDSFLAGETVNGVLQDSEGDLWFSTLGAGIYRLGARGALHYVFDVGSTPLPVFCIQKIDSVLYVGTERFHLFVSEDGRHFSDRRITDAFSRGRITAITRIGHNRNLVGTDAGTFVVRTGEKRGRLLWQFGAEKNLAVIGDSLTVDFGGLGVFVRQLRDGRILDTPWHSRATCGCLSGDTCYVGTLNGLYAVPRHRPAIFLGARINILKARIAALQTAPDGTLWIATYGEGLAAYKNGHLLTRITSRTGLTSDICRSLFIDGLAIWAGTDRGLDKIVLTDTGFRLKRFTSADGLSSDIINTVYVHGHEVLTGGPDGMTCFNEDDVAATTRPRLCMTGLTISGHAWPADTTNFTLGPAAGDLLFEFAGISFRSGGAVTYSYTLSGLDTGWKTTAQTSLHYPLLPPGSYALQLVAVNTSGSTSNVLRVYFTIRKPWWELIWLRILLITAAGGVVWYLVHRRIRTIRNKAIEKTNTATRIAELEQMALRSRMNPHFIFNCLNSIQVYVMDKDILGANEFITQFSRLIRQTLTISGKSQIALREEIDYLSTYLDLEKRRFEDKFVYTIVLSPGLNQHGFSIPPMILQPYVENALHHGMNHRDDNKGKITITIGQGTGYLVCTIEDNGVGRAQATQYKTRNANSYPSQGMELTARRIEMLNMSRRDPISVTIEDRWTGDHQPDGTRVIVRFPIFS